MNQAVSLLAGAGLGAGLMYLLDPQQGRRRRTLVRDKAVRLAHETQGAAEVVARDMRNRAGGLVSGDFSVLVGGRRALRHPLRGGWSPAGRALLAALGGGMFLYGLTRRAPLSCVLGSVGVALAAEAATNAGLDDLACVSRHAADTAANVAGRVTEGLGITGESRQEARELAGARA